MWNDFVQVCYGNALRLYKLRPLWEFSCLEVLTDGFLPTYLLDMKKGVTLHCPPGHPTDAAGRTEKSSSKHFTRFFPFGIKMRKRNPFGMLRILDL